MVAEDWERIKKKWGGRGFLVGTTDMGIFANWEEDYRCDLFAEQGL
jgi:hypothetical protein